MFRMIHVAALCAVVVLCSCQTASGARQRDPGDGGGIVVRGEDLTTSRILLEALEHRVPTLRVDRGGTGCPVVVVRGQAIGRQTGSAAVYVDGTRMNDTCILLQIQTTDVERVELYPVAGSRPQGFTAGAGGLILVHRFR